MMVLFLGSFADAKFHKNKTITKWQKPLLFSDVGKSRTSHEVLMFQICLLTHLAKI